MGSRQHKKGPAHKLPKRTRNPIAADMLNPGAENIYHERVVPDRRERKRDWRRNPKEFDDDDNEW